MNYYKTKARALKRIDQLYSDGKLEIEILYIVSTEFGFSENMIKKRLDLLDKMQERAKK